MRKHNVSCAASKHSCVVRKAGASAAQVRLNQALCAGYWAMKLARKSAARGHCPWWQRLHEA